MDLGKGKDVKDKKLSYKEQVEVLTTDEVRTFRCVHKGCGKTVTDKALTAVCSGVDFGVAVLLPDETWAVYMNGTMKDGTPIAISGTVVQRGSDGKNYNGAGDKVLEDNKWVDFVGTIPGSHKGQLMEVVS